MIRGDQKRTVAGSLLKIARFDLGMSQRELADRAGVAQSTIARIESSRAELIQVLRTSAASSRPLD
jgi:transcriptional regulator with XRE-family HTH domain